jgi:plasmid maintenance system antidote protein VapI
VRLPRITELRLSKYFGLSEQFWVNLQARFALEVEGKDSKIDWKKKFMSTQSCNISVP